MNSTWLITYELANQRARKVLFTCVVYTNYAYSFRWKKVYATFNGRGFEEIVFEHLEQLASPNLDSDSKELVFDRVETLYNTVVSVRWGNISMLWLNDRHLVKVF